MSNTKKIFMQLIGVCFLITTLLSGCTDNKKDQDQDAPEQEGGVEISSLKNPVPVMTGKGEVLVYELNILNKGSQPVRVGRIEIFGDEGKLLKSYASNELIVNSFLYGRDEKTGKNFTIQFGDKKQGKGKSHDEGIVLKFQKESKGRYRKKGSAFIDLKKDMGALVFVWVKLKEGQETPKALKNKIWITLPSADRSTYKSEIMTYNVDLNFMKPLVLGKPFLGTNWVATGALSPTSYHRQAALIIQNKLYLAQRYAIDWIQICDDGKEIKGDLHDNARWICYETPLLAVRGGVVTKIHEGVKSNMPPGFSVEHPKFEDVPGNYIILKIMEGEKPYYILYAHVKPGSINVKEGDIVKEGQELALLGNTGNSTQPHLHLHVMDENFALKSEGVPFTLKDAKLIGLAEEIDTEFGDWMPFKSIDGGFYKKVPTENQVFEFTADKNKKCEIEGQE